MPAADVSKSLRPALLCRPHRQLGAPALDELADLAADRRERGKLLFVALPMRAAKKLGDPEGVRVE